MSGARAPRQPKTLRIAAAADLQPVMPAFAFAYEKEFGVKLDVSFGSSSALATQIKNGAPFDVFLGADYVFPEEVIAAGLAEEKLPVPYAQGTLVLWSRKDSPLGPSARGAAYRSARDAHRHCGPVPCAVRTRCGGVPARNHLEEKLKGKLVTAENISQTAQFVESGNAQIGFVSLTFAASAHGKAVGNFARLAEQYPKIVQCGVVIKTSKDLDEARKFLDWMTGTRSSGASGGVRAAKREVSPPCA